MTTDNNIYDIDNDKIAEAGDIEALSIDEANERVKKYQEKLEKLVKEDPKNHKVGVYETYIRNLQRYIFNYYLAHPELITPKTTTEDQIAKAMEELKEEVAQEETKMDEYVDFEEVKDGEGA